MDYKSTATYYWSLIAENGFSTDSVTGFNDTKDATNNKVESSAGPFGFDEAILLGEEQVKIISYHPFYSLSRYLIQQSGVDRYYNF